MIGESVESSARPSLPLRYWVFGASLLLSEYVLAALLFDSDRLPVRASGGFSLLGESMSLVVVVTTATFIFGKRPSSDELDDVAEAFRARRRTWPLLLGHLVTYGVALGVTVLVFNAQREVLQPWLWVGVWATSGLLSLLLWLAAMVPARAVAPLRRSGVRALGVGLVVGVAAVLAGLATAKLWQPMSRMTLDLVVLWLRIAGEPVAAAPERLIVGIPPYFVFIDRQCSGYEGIGLITMMLGLYLFYSRNSLRFPQALLLLPIGIALIWISNGLRIAALIAVGAHLSQAVAEGGFHSAAGWLLFCFITLLLVAASTRVRWLVKHHVEPVGSSNPTAAYLVPLLTLIGAGLVTALFTAEFDWLYPLRIALPLIPLWVFRDYYRELRWSWSWTPVGIGVAVFVMWIALEPARDPADVSRIPDALSGVSTAVAGVWLVSRVLGSSIVVPVVEELAFRGYLVRRLISADFSQVSPKQFTALSFIVSSVAFGALHQRWLAGILAGMAYAFAQYRRGEITDAIVAHAVTNTLLAVYVLAFGQWGFW
jgi:exosortase E/protease (VPEID-CTERM system)